MIFSDLYKGQRSPLAKLRHHTPATATPADTTSAPAVPAAADNANGPDWISEEFADLLSRDKVKQKEAVKRYLSAKVKNDWVFTWPPASLDSDVNVNGHGASSDHTDGKGPAQAPGAADDANAGAATEQGFVQDETKEDDGYQVDDSDNDEERLSVQPDADDVSIYSIVSEDPLHYRPRMDWTSDTSDIEPIPFHSAFRYSSPDDVGLGVQAAVEERKAKHRREAREEAKWNEGLACFEARRNAWTGARTVRIKTKPVTNSSSSRSAKRFFFRRSISSSPPAVSAPMPIAAVTASQSNSGADTSAVTSDGSSGAAHNDSDRLRPQRTKDSTASTLAPEASYPVQTLIPLAPPILPPENCLRASINPSVYINLYEKRDGEWPPRAPMPPAPPASSAAVTAAINQKKQQQAAKKAKRMSNAGQSTAEGGGVSAGSNVARRMSFGLLGKKEEEDASKTSAMGSSAAEGTTPKSSKGIRRSLQKAFGMGGVQEAHHAQRQGEGTAV